MTPKAKKALETLRKEGFYEKPEIQGNQTELP
jgi:hypothetical protein